MPAHHRAALAVAALALTATACSAGSTQRERPVATPSQKPASPSATAPAPGTPAATGALRTIPGMPPVTDPQNVYAADGPGMFSPKVKGAKALVYVPNLLSNTVDVIDPKTFRIVDHFAVGRGPQHVVPSYDLQTLWVNDNLGNSLTPIDPRTGKPGTPVPVEDPYNLYFTPDGKHAIVMAERDRAIDFRDPHTMALQHRLHVPDCKGVNHADFSADGRYFIATCEFAGRLIKVDTLKEEKIGEIQLSQGGMPQDIKLSPDGKVFYVADMMANGVYLVDGDSFRKIGFIPTGKGTHGLYASRDAKYLYASNRNEGTISVISFATRKVVRVWQLPGGGSPDMGNVSADGKVLWLSGRYNSEVYAIDTRNGHLLARIKVGDQPHGLCVWPQPGRYSLGHTGIMR